MTKEELSIELEKLGIILTEEQSRQLEKFYQILIEENEKINLTRITEKNEVYLKHFYDSLTLIKLIDFSQVETVLDVGSGAGFPGIVLKIVFPHLKITLLDALKKRVNYLNKTIDLLNLKNIVAIHERSEVYAHKNKESFDIVTARAVANLKVLSELTIPLVKLGGYFLAMKGNIEEEVKEAEEQIEILGGKIVQIDEFALPKEGGNRTLIKIEKMKSTPNQYPRTMDKIKKAKKK